MTHDIGDRIRAYIARELMFEEDASALAWDTPLLETHLDSLGLLQVVGFLEEEFDVTIDDAEVTADNFRTVQDIQRLVERKAR